MPPWVSRDSTGVPFILPIFHIFSLYMLLLINKVFPFEKFFQKKFSFNIFLVEILFVGFVFQVIKY